MEKIQNFRSFLYEYAIEQILDGTIEEEEKKHILFSLERMFASGVNDLVRGGFHRYHD